MADEERPPEEEAERRQPQHEDEQQQQQQQREQRQQASDGNDDEEEDDGDDDDDDAEKAPAGGRKIEQGAFRRLAEKLDREPVSIRVHDVSIRGNVKTKEWVIEALLEKVKNATTVQEVLQEASRANVNLQKMGVFDRCVIRLDAGPKELPGTTNIIVEVEESKRPFSCDVGVFSKPETRNWTLEGSLKWKNLLGYGETWDGKGCYGWDATTETSVGASFPRFRNLPASMFSRASLFTQDWHKYSSYKERLVGLSCGLVHDRNHELSYNLTWRLLTDPLHKASKAVRADLGHDLLSSIKYSFVKDHRDSAFRPTQGYAFATNIQVAGIGPDQRLTRFVKKEVDFRAALPLGFLNSAFNVGMSAGMVIPWGPDFMNKRTPISDRLFMGGLSSLVGELRGPCSLPGFDPRGVGPSDIRRHVKDEDSPIGRDALGGEVAWNCFADLSMDIPYLQFLKDFNIHAHAFVCAGNVMDFSELRSSTARDLVRTTRVSSGIGLVIPTKLFRMEVNHCTVLKYQDKDRLKQGLQFCFSS